jgi:hypothetical protein
MQTAAWGAFIVIATCIDGSIRKQRVWFQPLDQMLAREEADQEMGRQPLVKDSHEGSQPVDGNQPHVGSDPRSLE